MDYLAEPRQKFDPDYDLSDHKSGKKNMRKGLEDGLDPIDRLDAEEMINTDNFYTYEDSN